MSKNRYIDKVTMAYIHNGILWSCKNHENINLLKCGWIFKLSGRQKRINTMNSVTSAAYKETK